MMEERPKLRKGQFALVRADGLTAHVLDKNGELAVRPHQQVYAVCNDYEDALTTAKAIVSTGKDECLIYDYLGTVIAYLKPLQY